MGCRGKLAKWIFSFVFAFHAINVVSSFRIQSLRRSSPAFQPSFGASLRRRSSIYAKSFVMQSQSSTAASTAHRESWSSVEHVYDPTIDVGGDIVVSGLSDGPNDEHLLEMLNQQRVWSRIVVLTADAARTNKRLLSRSARYSGLFDLLDVQQPSEQQTEEDKLREVLSTATGWLAFNVSQREVLRWGEIALDLNVSRVLFTTQLRTEQFEHEQRALASFDHLRSSFLYRGLRFTGIRHGEISSEGEDDLPYFISNSSTPCISPAVPHRLLARVATELLTLPCAFNRECGLSSAHEFVAEYLYVLRSAGLSRREEVHKMFTGGVERAAEMFLNSDHGVNESKTITDEEERWLRTLERKPIEEDQEELNQQPRQHENERLCEDLISIGEAKFAEKVAVYNAFLSNEDKIVANRTEEILNKAWNLSKERGIVVFSKKSQFFEMNNLKAERKARIEYGTQKEAVLDVLNKRNEADELCKKTREMYSRLLTLEHRELSKLQARAHLWLRFIFVLLDAATLHCQERGISLSQLDESSLFELLKQVVNDIRTRAGLPIRRFLFDEEDAERIVSWSNHKDALALPIDDLRKMIKSKFFSWFRNIPPLYEMLTRTIEILHRELPSPQSASALSRPMLIKMGRIFELLRKRSLFEITGNAGRWNVEEEQAIGQLNELLNERRMIS